MKFSIYTFTIRMILVFAIGLSMWKGESLYAQSLEIMPGTERIFADMQWLKFIDSRKQFSIFSRTRATVDYDNTSSFFTAGYLNYTSPIDLGLTLVGKINDTGGGGDIGIHLFKAKSNWTLFALASIGLKSELEYSWFSIFRYTPAFNNNWKLYTSLELFSLLTSQGHAFSVQRIRVGMDYKGFQFGVANNLSELGMVPITDNNFGGFIRKSF